MKRREFVLSALSGASLLSLPKTVKAAANSFSEPLSPAIDISPIQRLTSFSGSSEVEGDLPDEAHEIFWNRDGYLAKKGGIPKVSETYDVVIVGGGISGLASAYHSQGKKVLLLEGNPRLGGNSKSQVFNKSYASQGAAYIVQPEAGDEIDQFLGSLKINNLFRKVNHDEETVFMNGKLAPDFWNGTTDPSRAPEFRFVHQKLTEVYNDAYPELPIWDSSAKARSHFNALDKISFAKWAESELRTNHQHIWEYLELYCWSSFGASVHELSAAQVLNFITSDLNGIQVLPGGNGVIAQALYEALAQRPGMKILTNSFAVDIRSEGGRAVVCFRDSSNNLKTVQASHCIVASPKMVAKKIISSASSAQLQAMSGLTYRAYLVANIFLNKKVRSPGYDLFNLYGAAPQRPYDDSKNRVFADLVFADWAYNDSANQSILTAYLPLPYDMAQQYLFVPDLYNKYVQRIMFRLQPHLPTLGLTQTDVAGVRLVRFGHSMAVGFTGGVSSGLFERASQSIDGCIHFANQDNWGNPCFETSYGSALQLVKNLR